jgi:hypothetical protein
MALAGAVSHSEIGFCGEGLERNVGMILCSAIGILVLEDSGISYPNILLPSNYHFVAIWKISSELGQLFLLNLKS